MAAARFFLFLFLLAVGGAFLIWILYILGRIKLGGKFIFERNKLEKERIENDLEGLEKSGELYKDVIKKSGKSEKS